MSILVIGDTCKDIFVYCHCERLCPEAPVPVLDIIEKVESWGMAGNVDRNIKSLNTHCKLVTNYNHSLVTKTRYVEKKTNHMFIRIDSTDKIERISQKELARLLPLSNYDAVVISDYNKGFLKEEDIEFITRNHPLTFLDTKKILGKWASSAAFIKINRKEYSDSKEQIEKFGLQDKVIQTLGSGGCEYQGQIYPVKGVEVKDLSGAGDSFLAALVVEYLKTEDISKSLVAANEAASIVVQKMGVSVINE